MDCARDVYRYLTRNGFDAWLDGDQLHVAPTERIDADLADAIRRYKESLIGMLKWHRSQGFFHPPARCRVCGEFIWARDPEDLSWFCANCFPKAALLTDRWMSTADVQPSAPAGHPSHKRAAAETADTVPAAKTPFSARS